MNDILFGNNNRKILKKLANRSLKSGKNYIAILAIMLSTLLFTSLFTIAISLQSSIQDNEMRTVGTSAHANAKLITENEYEDLISDERIKEYGKSVVFGWSTSGDRRSKDTATYRGTTRCGELPSLAYLGVKHNGNRSDCPRCH